MLSLYIYECFVSTLRLSSHWSFAVNHRLTSTNQIISRRAPTPAEPVCQSNAFETSREKNLSRKVLCAVLRTSVELYN